LDNLPHQTKHLFPLRLFVHPRERPQEVSASTVSFTDCVLVILFSRLPRSCSSFLCCRHDYRVTEDTKECDNYAMFLSLVGATCLALRRHESVRASLSLVRLMVGNKMLTSIKQVPRTVCMHRRGVFKGALRPRSGSERLLLPAL
jgi:hypothetical protein